MIEAVLHFDRNPSLFPPRAGMVCCGGEIMPERSSGPARTYQCPGCQTRYTVIVKPERRVMA